mgnify:FL=1
MIPLVTNDKGFFVANASSKVKEVFKSTQRPMTLNDIQKAVPDLKASEISMALCYFMRQRYLSREQIANTSMGRKKIWLYHFHTTKLEKPNASTQEG